MALTDKQKRQRNLLDLLADPTDTRSKKAKREEAKVPKATYYHWLENDSEFADAHKRRTETLRTVGGGVGLRVLIHCAENALEEKDRIAAAGKLVVACGYGGGNVNISTTVNVENEIKQKSDDELAKEIAEDEDLLRRAEVLVGVEE